MNDEWCIEKLQNLKIEENCLAALTEIRSKLNQTLNLDEIITNTLLSSPEIYDCIKESQSEEGSGEKMNIVSDILEICMSNISITQSDFPQLLQRALTHPQSAIRSVALNTILKEVQKNSVHGNLMTPLSNNLLKYVLQALKNPESECGLPAVSILSMTLVHYLDRADVHEILTNFLKENEIIKCRVYELAVNLAKVSPQTLLKVTYLLDSCLSELDNNDVLTQMNILELLYHLAEVNHGLVYLKERRVFDILSCRIEQMNQNPVDSILVPGIMKFFGKTSSLQPEEIITGYPYLINCFFDCIHNGDAVNFPVALDTFANLAKTHHGKVLLNRLYRAEIQQSFEDMAAALKSMSVELKERILSCLTELFSVNPGESIDKETNSILEQWFSYLAGEKNMQFMLDYCRNPFPDVKVTSLEFVKALCRFKWGIVAVKNTAGFVEFLLDRNQEFDKDVKYAKYEVISLLAESSVFEVHTSSQLRSYVKEGPFYVKVQMEVAVEGD